MASIRKLASGHYQVQIRAVGIPAVTRSFSTKKLAREFAIQVEGDSELARALGKAPSSIPTFSSICDIYMSNYTGRDNSTVGRLNWWKTRFGNTPITKIDEFNVDDGLLNLKSKGLTGSTINRYKSTLSAVFIYFIQHPDFKRAKFNNPVRKESVSRFRENPAKDRFLSEIEQRKLLQSCRESNWDKLYLLVLMALTTGARKGELLGLSWSNIDLQSRVASLSETKNGKPRLLPLTASVVEELLMYRKVGTALVFEGVVSPDKPYEFKKPWARALAAAGIGECRFHDLRHTAASNLVRAGRSLFEVGTLLGHSSTNMTARYSHLAIQDTQNMVDAVMGALK
jgi:integrase